MCNAIRLKVTKTNEFFQNPQCHATTITATLSIIESALSSLEKN
jgi:hypothetical protein